MIGIYLFITIFVSLLSINSIAGTPISNKNTIEWSHLISKRDVNNENRETSKADLRKNKFDDTGISDDEGDDEEDPDNEIDWHLLSPSNNDELNEALRSRRKRAISAYTNLASSQMARVNNRKKIRQPIYRPVHKAGQSYKKLHWRSKRELIVNNEDDADDSLNGDLDNDNEPLTDQELQQLAQLIYEMQLLNDKASSNDGRIYSYADELEHHPLYIDPSGSPVRLRLRGSRKKKRSLEPSYYGYRTSPERPLPRNVVWLRPAANVDGDGNGNKNSGSLDEIGTVVGPYDASVLANSPYAYEPAFYGASTLRDATEAANRRRLGEMELEKRIVSLARYLNARALRRRRRR